MFDPMEVAEVLGADPAPMDDDTLTGHLLAAVALAERAEATALAAAAEFDARALWANDGAVNAGQWLAGHAHLSGRQARSLARAARTLGATTDVADALRAGTLNVGQAKALAAVRNQRTAQLFDAHEPALIEAARHLSVDDTIRLARQWQLRADTDGPDPKDDDQSARLSPIYHGRFRLDANLNADGGLIVQDVLNDIMEDLYRSATAEGRPHDNASRRRADALVEMARRATAAHDDQPAARPLIVIRAELSDLETRAGRPAVTDTGAPLDWATMREFLCDADVCRVVTDGPSQPIDVGRSSRTATTAQRRALLIRDGGCVFPGCDRPPGWCHAHHITWWDNNGRTDLDNLCLLCSRHHHQIHRGTFNVERDNDGHLLFTRADDTIIEQPPRHAWSTPI